MKVIFLSIIVSLISFSCMKEYSCECNGKRESRVYEHVNGLTQDTLLLIEGVYNVNFEETIETNKKESAESMCSLKENEYEGYTGTIGGNDSIMLFTSADLTCKIK